MLTKSLSRQKQAFRHRPEEGVFGDCNRTAIACVLGIERDSLPHEHRYMDGSEFAEFTSAFLAGKGLHVISIPVSAATVEDAMLFGYERGGRIPFILAGQSPRLVNHSVVIFGPDDMHDPSLDGGGLIGPCEPTGYFWCDWIVGLPHRTALETKEGRG